MPDEESKLSTTHLQISYRDPETSSDDSTDDVDKGGSCEGFQLSCLTQQPVKLGNVAYLRLNGISSPVGLVFFSTYGSVSILNAKDVESGIVETVSFVNETKGTLSKKPIGTPTYRWLGKKQGATGGVTFNNRDVVLKEASSGLLEVTYNSQYMSLILAGVSVAPSTTFTVFVTAQFGDCKSSCEVDYYRATADDEEEKDYQQSESEKNGYKEGYKDGKHDFDNGNPNGESFDDTPMNLLTFGDGYREGYEDGKSDLDNEQPYRTSYQPPSPSSSNFNAGYDVGFPAGTTDRNYGNPNGIVNPDANTYYKPGTRSGDELEGYNRGYESGYNDWSSRPSFVKCGEGYDIGYNDGFNGKDYDDSLIEKKGGYSMSESQADAYKSSYADGYDDGIGDEEFDDGVEPKEYASIDLQVLDYCTGEAIPFAVVEVNGEEVGLTDEEGWITLEQVAEGDNIRMTASGYVPSDEDSLANDIIPRIVEN